MNKKDVIDKFRNKDTVCIFFDELSMFEVGEIIQINKDREGAVECERLHNKGDHLMFRVFMKDKEKWEIHYHNCYETLLVYKGKLLDVFSDQIAEKGRVLTFDPFEEHTVRSVGDSIFYVEFRKP